VAAVSSCVSVDEIDGFVRAGSEIKELIVLNSVTESTLYTNIRF